MAHEDVAIIGMACLFPKAPDLATFWHNVVSKTDALSEPPEDDPAGIARMYDPDSEEPSHTYCSRGGFLSPLAYFDPLEHGIIPLAIDGAEPDQWLALAVACAAFRDAGYDEDIPERERTAVILGKGLYLNRGNTNAAQHTVGINETLEILADLNPECPAEALDLIREELRRSLPNFDVNTASGIIPNITAGRIANRLDLMGPSFTVDGACASSLIATDIAVRNLQTDQCDLALVGGVNVTTVSAIWAVFSQLGAFSRKQQVRPFDKDADGTLPGEGVGMVVLKRLADAVRDDNRIYAVIRGIALSSDGRGLSVTAPRLEGEVVALTRAYEQADVSPTTLELIEAHGTATPVGDAAEIAALKQVFGPRDGDLPRCALGSVKSMIGHLMPAAGIAGLIKTSLALYHKVLPPTLNVEEPNPDFELDKSVFYLNTETRPWIHGGQSEPRRAGVNCFGFGGINAHVILDEHLVPDETEMPSLLLDWDSEVCIVSAQSRAELIDRTDELQEFLQAQPQVRLKDLAYTLNVKRCAGPCQLAVVASSLEDLAEKLEHAQERLSDPDRDRIKDVRGIYFFEERLAETGQIAYLLPGEGSQYPNMLADLCLHFPEVRRQFDLGDAAFAGHARDYTPSDFIFPRPTFSEQERRQAEARLWRMGEGIEASLFASYALLQLLNNLEIHPDAMVGHSAGEYTALTASGMMDLSDETRCAQFARDLYDTYAKAAAEADVCKAALIAVAADYDTVSKTLEPVGAHVRAAMDNCPHQAVVVCDEQLADKAIEALREQGLIYERLAFDRPYHTPLFEDFALRFEGLFNEWIVSPPKVKVYSCATVAPFPDDLAQIPRMLVEQWMLPVRFRQTIQTMHDDGVRIFVEAGPRGNLSAFVDDILRGQPHLTVPANVMNRSGITQLNHLAGLLAAHGVAMRLEHLYVRRAPQDVAMNQPDDPYKKGAPSRTRVRIATGWPAMSLSEEAKGRLRATIGGPIAASATAQQASAISASTANPTRDAQVDRLLAALPAQEASCEPAGSGATQQPADQDAQRPVSADAVEAVMAAHMRTMEQFLDTQHSVMEAFLSDQPSSGLLAAMPTASAAPEAEAPPQPVSNEADAQEAALTSPAEQHGAEPITVSEPAAPTRESVTDALLQLVSERTGYPVEMIDVNLHLESELGIDSIKRVEILSSFQKATGLLKEEDAEALSGANTLQEVIDLVRARGGEATASQHSRPDRASDVPEAALPDVTALPLVASVEAFVPGRQVTAVREIEAEEDLFLYDHSLGRDISDADPSLSGLLLMPLTMTMELMAEAASLLAPHKLLTGMRQVRAHRWIAPDEAPVRLCMVAEARPSEGQVEVQVRVTELAESDDSRGTGAPLVAEGVMVFADAYPDAPPASELELPSEDCSQWDAERTYAHVNFHGPMFREVVSIQHCPDKLSRAVLEVKPRDRLFRSAPDPRFLADPVLLDQPGHIMGVWSYEYLDHAHVIMPFRLQALELYGPLLSPGERVECHLRFVELTEMTARVDADLVRDDGTLWARLLGWEERRFDTPRPMHRFLLSPREGLVSTPWPAVEELLAELERFEARRVGPDDLPKDYLTGHGRIWRRALAHLILSEREQELWRSLKTPQPRRLEWLLGRLVAKDAVRTYLKEHYDAVVCPADIEILPDENGRPVPQGAWSEQLGVAPLLSLSHSGGVAVALVCDSEAASGLGVDIEQMDRTKLDVQDVAFDARERALLASLNAEDEKEWLLRLWCAKEAVGKALGHGLKGGPGAFIATRLDLKTGVARIEVPAKLVSHLPGGASATLTARTMRDGPLVVAVCVSPAQEV